MRKAYIRTTSGGFNDDRFQLTEAWQEVDPALISGDDLENPKLEVRIEEEKESKAKAKDAPEPTPAQPEPATPPTPEAAPANEEGE